MYKNVKLGYCNEIIPDSKENLKEKMERKTNYF